MKKSSFAICIVGLLAFHCTTPKHSKTEQKESPECLSFAKPPLESGDSLSLPVASSGYCLPNAPIVAISLNHIWVDGKAIATITDGNVDITAKPDGPEGFLILPLLSVFTEKNTAQSSTKETDQHSGVHINIAADKNVSFRLLTEVFYTLGKAHFTNFQMLVRNPAGGQVGVLPVLLPQIGRTKAPPNHRSTPPLHLTLEVRNTGIIIAASGGVLTGPNPALPTVPLTEKGEYDWSALAEKLASIKQNFPNESSIILNLKSNVPVELLVKTMVAAQQTNDGKQLFPDQIVSAPIDVSNAATKRPKETKRHSDIQSCEDVVAEQNFLGLDFSTFGSAGDLAPPPAKSYHPVQGSLSKAEILPVIKENIDLVRKCYERELPTHPEMEGKVIVKFVVGETGSVDRAEISESSLDNPAVTKCIREIFCRSSFPAPRGGIVIISYPFVFRPQGDSHN